MVLAGHVEDSAYGGGTRSRIVLKDDAHYFPHMDAVERPIGAEDDWYIRRLNALGRECLASHLVPTELQQIDAVGGLLQPATPARLEHDASSEGRAAAGHDASKEGVEPVVVTGVNDPVCVTVHHSLVGGGADTSPVGGGGGGEWHLLLHVTVQNLSEGPIANLRLLTSCNDELQLRDTMALPGGASVSRPTQCNTTALPTTLAPRQACQASRRPIPPSSPACARERA